MKSLTTMQVTSIEALEMLIANVKSMNKPFSLTANIGIEFENFFALPTANPAIEAAVAAAEKAIAEQQPIVMDNPKPIELLDAPTRTEMLALIKRAVDKLGPDKLKTILKAYGGEKLSAIDEGKWEFLRSNILVHLESAGA